MIARPIKRIVTTTKRGERGGKHRTTHSKTIETIKYSGRTLCFDYLSALAGIINIIIVMSTGGKRYEHVERVLHELYILGTRQATARDMLNTIKQRCFMLSDPCHVEKDNAACLFPAKCIRMFAPTS